MGEEWFAKPLEDTVRLPGTTDENRKGIKKDEQCLDRLSRVWFWKGPAWYQRSVTIPDVWNGIIGRMELRATDPVWIEDVQVYPDAVKKEAAYHNIDRLDIETTETEITLYDYGKRESELIFRHFGNHPSFVTYTLGNELGRNQAMFELIDTFQQLDPRRLYAQASNQMHWNPSLAEGDDFWVGTALT